MVHHGHAGGGRRCAIGHFPLDLGKLRLHPKVSRSEFRLEPAIAKGQIRVCNDLRPELSVGKQRQCLLPQLCVPGRNQQPDLSGCSQLAERDTYSPQQQQWIHLGFATQDAGSNGERETGSFPLKTLEVAMALGFKIAGYMSNSRSETFEFRGMDYLLCFTLGSASLLKSPIEAGLKTLLRFLFQSLPPIDLGRIRNYLRIDR